MKDNEFYQSPELWPQPPDERPTLETEEFVPGRTGQSKQKSNRKKRRKLTDSLSSLVIGAIAIVMVATAIAPSKDDEDDFIGFGGPSEEEICQVCGDLICPYWVYDGYSEWNEGLHISLTNSDGYWGYPENTLGYSSSNYIRENRTYCLYTQEGIRLFLKLDPYDLPIPVSGYGSSYGWYGSNGACPAQGNAAVSVSYEFEYDASVARGGTEEEILGHVYAQLIYAPDGECPAEGFALGEENNSILTTIPAQYNPENDTSFPFVYTKPYAGAQNVWIRVYSDISQELCETAVECCEVDVTYGDGLTYSLGETMAFQENGDAGLLWFGGIYSANAYTHQRDGVDYTFRADFERQVYHLWSVDNYAKAVVLRSGTFTEMVESWQALNDGLPADGHEEIFHLKELPETDSNGIVYKVYLAWYDSAYDQDVTLILIPQQEDRIALLFRYHSFYMQDIDTVDSLDQFLVQSGETQQGDWTASVYTLLDQITLSDGSGWGDNSSGGSVGGDQSGVCSICGESDCAFYRISNGTFEEVFTLEVPCQDFTYSNSVDWMKMDGTVVNGGQEVSNGCLYTEEGIRLALHVDQQKLPFSYSDASWMKYRFGSSGAFPSAEEASVVLWMDCFDPYVEQRGGVEESFVFQLVYGPNGDSITQGYGAQYADYFLYHYAVPVEGVEDVWLHVFNNLSDSLGEGLAAACGIEIIEGTGLTYQLGQTMTFQETDTIGRLWNEEHSNLHSQTVYIQDSEAGTNKGYPFRFCISQKTYNILCGYEEVNIVHFGASFPDIASEWMALNAQAPQKGHQVVCEMKQLEDYTVNGITYYVYAAWAPSDSPSVAVFMVPQQEDQIAVVFHDKVTATTDWQTLDELKAACPAANIVDTMLAQIDLK